MYKRQGWGVAPEGPGNAIAQANLPVFNKLRGHSPYTQLWTHGLHVGLPGKKDLGGSEVGHMTMGAGVVMETGTHPDQPFDRLRSTV